jgi:hypothetical protein
MKRSGDFREGEPNKRYCLRAKNFASQDNFAQDKTDLWHQNPFYPFEPPKSVFIEPATLPEIDLIPSPAPPQSPLNNPKRPSLLGQWNNSRDSPHHNRVGSRDDISSKDGPQHNPSINLSRGNLSQQISPQSPFNNPKRPSLQGQWNKTQGGSHRYRDGSRDDISIIDGPRRNSSLNLSRDDLFQQIPAKFLSPPQSPFNHPKRSSFLGQWNNSRDGPHYSREDSRDDISNEDGPLYNPLLNQSNEDLFQQMPAKFLNSPQSRFNPPKRHNFLGQLNNSCVDARDDVSIKRGLRYYNNPSINLSRGNLSQETSEKFRSPFQSPSNSPKQQSLLEQSKNSRDGSHGSRHYISRKKDESRYNPALSLSREGRSQPIHSRDGSRGNHSGKDGPPPENKSLDLSRQDLSQPMPTLPQRPTKSQINPSKRHEISSQRKLAQGNISSKKSPRNENQSIDHSREDRSKGNQSRENCSQSSGNYSQKHVAVEKFGLFDPLVPSQMRIEQFRSIAQNFTSPVTCEEYKRTNQDQLSKSIWKYVTHHCLNQNQFEKKIKLWLLLDHIVSSRWMDSQVLAFGSTVSGFGSNKSDLDLVVFCPLLPPPERTPSRENGGNQCELSFLSTLRKELR